MISGKNARFLGVENRIKREVDFDTGYLMEVQVL